MRRDGGQDVPEDLSRIGFGLPGRRLGEEAASDELAVTVDGVKMDVEGGIGGEGLEPLLKARERLVMAHLLGEEFFEGSQDGRGRFGCSRQISIARRRKGKSKACSSCS